MFSSPLQRINSVLEEQDRLCLHLAGRPVVDQAERAQPATWVIEGAGSRRVARRMRAGALEKERLSDHDDEYWLKHGRIYRHFHEGNGWCEANDY